MRQLSGGALHIESAGTGDWTLGKPPDSRAQAVAAARGYDISTQRARQICAADFTRFDLILGMDAQNIADITAHPGYPGRAVVAAFLPFCGLTQPKNVPDPWFTGDFEGVLTLIESACSGVIKDIA